jgi:hypothetical protein
VANSCCDSPANSEIRYHVLGPLQSLEADNRDGSGFRPAFLDTAPCKFIDFLAGDCVLLTFGSAFEREVIPGVRVLLIKQLRMQATHDAPYLSAEPDHLLSLPQPEPVRAVDNLIVDLVSGSWRDLSDLPLADAIASEPGEAILKDLAPKPDSEVLLLVNGFGATPLIELYLMANSAGRIGRCRAQSDVFPDWALRNITRHGRRIDDGIVLDDQAKELWDAPVHTAAMR